MHDVGNQDVAGRRGCLQACGNIDAIAEQILVFPHDVSEMYTYAQL